MHLDYISLIPFPTASSANRPAVSFKGCSYCAATALDTTVASSGDYYPLLGITSSYWAPPTPLGTTADATIGNADIMKV